MAGVAVYPVAHNGFRIFPLILPLLFILFFVRSGKRLNERLRGIRAEIKARNAPPPARPDAD